MPVNRGGSIEVRGLDELIREVKKLDDAEKFELRIKDANYKVGELVKVGSLPSIPTKTGAARSSLTVSKTLKAARLSMGGAKAPHALGVEFGAKQNLRRIVKERAIRFGTDKEGNRTTRLGARGRATVVRDGEDIDSVIGRVTQQSVDEFGRTQAKGRGVLVKVARYKNGSPKVRLGWNHFRSWRGIGPDAGYAIFPFIKRNNQVIVELYEDEIADITGDAFPD